MKGVCQRGGGVSSARRCSAVHATARDAPSRVAAGVAATRGRARLRWVSRRGALTSRTENATTAIARGRVGVTCDAAKSAVSAVSGVGRGAVVCSAAASNGASASGFDTSKVRIGEEGIIINVYAESLLEAAKEAGGSVLEKVASDMDVLEMAVSAPEFVDYLNNPVVELQAKVTTIKNSAKDLGWHEFTVNALELLLTKNREWVIPDLPYAFKQLYNALAKTMRVEVVSSVKLTNEQTFKIVSIVQKMTGASNVKCKNVVDSDMQAGLIIKYGEDLDSMIDLTLSRDVALMKKTFDTEISKAFVESIGIDDEYPTIAAPPFVESLSNVDDFAEIAKKHSGMNERFVETLDANERQEWSDKLRMA